jgi:diguanylate cyclase (GGDEF)-like protein/PAS domain S-box-containing protein
MSNVLRVLMVEDNPDDAFLELQTIQQGGYTVFSERVDTRNALLQSFTNNHWDLVISDYSMPNFSGVEALQVIREHDTDIPFIFVSGTIGEERAVAAIKNGANDYVNKDNLVRLIPVMERVFEEIRIKKENVATRQALEESQERFYHAFHHTGIGVALVNMDSGFIEINKSFCKMLGYSNNELLDMKISELIEKNSQAIFNATLNNVLQQKTNNSQIELRLLHKNKQKLWAILNLSLIKHIAPNKPFYLIIQVQDRTEQKYFEEKLLFLTTYNGLTGLLNRSTLFNKINSLIQNKGKAAFALYYIDIDRFKRVNETYGAHLGDHLLRCIANRLKEHVDPHEVLGYLGGNEFLIINHQMINKEECINYSKHLCNTLLKPILMQDTELTLTASLGITRYPHDGKSATDLLKTASSAIRESKNKGGDCFTIYRDGINQSSNHLIIENDLRKAINNNELLIYYQPQIDALTKKPTGLEALVRWKKNDKLIPPDEFIPIAEESSLILKIGEEVLKQACACFVQLRKSSVFIPERLSVNLSARQLADERLIPKLRAILKTQKMDPQHLELEITESALIENIEEVDKVINTLCDMGIKIAIDDFGVGYSSLGYLKNLRVNRIKIDKSFVNSCLIDHNSQSIIASIITLAHRLGLEVTAEGVETLEQQQFLLKHHCDEFQGYYFSPPVSQEHLSHYLSQCK